MLTDEVITLSLPHWFPPVRQNYTDPVYYPDDHAKKGQIEKWVEGNRSVDAIKKLPGFRRLDLIGKTISFVLNGKYTAAKTKVRLHNYLCKFCEAIERHEETVKS